MLPRPLLKAASPGAPPLDQPRGYRVDDDRSHSSDHVNWWQLIAHGVAFCAASAIAAIVFSPYYPKFRDQTDSAGEAFGALLTLCVIFGGIGPLITLLFFTVQCSAWLRRSVASASRERGVQ